MPEEERSILKQELETIELQFHRERVREASETRQKDPGVKKFVLTLVASQLMTQAEIDEFQASLPEEESPKTAEDLAKTLYSLDNQPKCNGPWLGGYQTPSDSTPADANWHWVTGEPWNDTNWEARNPDDYGGYQQDRLHFYLEKGEWNDISNNDPNYGTVVSYIIEWDSSKTGRQSRCHRMHEKVSSPFPLHITSSDPSAVSCSNHANSQSPLQSRFPEKRYKCSALLLRSNRRPI